MRRNRIGGAKASSALWGRRSDDRASALWGRGGRGTLAAGVLGILLVVPVIGSAATRDGRSDAAVPASLLASARAEPNRTFHVVVQASQGRSSADVAHAVGDQHGNATKEFRSIDGAAADVTGGQLIALSHDSHVATITPDVPLRTTAYQDATMWKYSVDFYNYTWQSSTAGIPGVAIVDSGIQDRKEFPRILAHVNLSSLAPVGGDAQGHGTMVAGLAGGTGKYGGAGQSLPLIDVKTADAQGQSLTSDVIAACDWILANKAKYNIRVANFSMAGNVASSFTSDPLDKAVEKLWFGGIVVVAAAGNGGTGTGEVPITAPANDPFVITAGALDQHSTQAVADDTLPSWSSYGHTIDGFQKPELSAPGRYLIAPVPAGSTLSTTFPDRVIDAAPNMWMSGTSFAAPIISGSAALVIYRHPDWTPDQVKGALMVSARAVPAAGIGAGVGEVDIAAAANVVAPPNANENLTKFVVADPTTGAKTFDVAGWTSAVSSSANWTTANWSGANWSGANWSTANWATASWSTANWATANWTTANWATANWTDAGNAE